MLEGQVPDGEGLKLGVTGGHSPLIIMIELGKAGRHLTAAGSGRCDHHQGTAGLNIVILAKALVADHIRHIGRIPGNGIMAVALNPKGGKALDKSVRSGLSRITGDHDAAYIQVHAAENIDQAQNIIFIGDAKIAADLALFNVRRSDGNDDLHIVLELLEHPDLAVRLKPRQHPGGMIVVKELAAKFQIQLAAELGDPLADLLGLGGEVLLIVKPDGIHSVHNPFCSFHKIEISIPPFFPFVKK